MFLKKYTAIIFLFFIVLILGISNYKQYGGMDCGALSQLSWRLYLGQKAYSEIPTALPPIFIIPLKYIYTLFGIQNIAFIYFNYVVTLLFFIVYYFLINRIIKNNNVSFFFTTLFLISTLQIFPYWWYNTISITILFGYVLSTILIFDNHNSKINLFFKIIFTSFLLLSKINIALPSLFLFETTIILFYITKKLNFKKYIFCLIFSIIFFAIIINLFDINLKDYIDSIRIQSGRLNLQNFINFYYYHEPRFSFIIPEIILTTLSISFFYKKNIKSIFADFKQILVINLLIISFIGKLTNNDFNIIENIIPILIIFIFNFEISKPKSAIYNLNIILIPFLVAYLLLVIIRRDRIMAIGPFWETKKALYLQQNKDDYFYKFQLPLRLIEVEKDIYNLKNRIIQPAFFGARIDHAYANLNIKVARNIPIWWEGISVDSKYTLYFKQANFKTLCFLNETPKKGYTPDFTFLNEEIKKYILKNYVIDSNFKNIVLYKLK
jgi:hypothetical protein